MNVKRMLSGRPSRPRPALIAATLALAAVPARAGDEPVFAHGFEPGEASSWSAVVTPCPEGGRSRYPHLDPMAPFTPCVVEKVSSLFDAASGPEDNVFLEAGASGTLSSSFLACFAGESIDLDGRNELQATIDFFLNGNAAGVSPFERESLAAGLGRSAGWAIDGDPSPLEQEISAIDPGEALIDFGLNDMQLGASYGAALDTFYGAMSELLDELEAAGIVPIVTGLNPRADSAAAALWVPTWDVVSRGIAEERRLPYLSLYRSMVNLPDMGLVEDGLNGNVYDPGSGAEPCNFTAPALLFNYNLRNLRTLELLDALRRSGLEGAPATAVPGIWSGAGTAADPIVVDRLPFTHGGDTSLAAEDQVEAYPACSAADFSGPEVWYRLEVTETTPVRITALDRDTVAVDVALISGGPDPAGCLEVSSGVIETTLAPGTYHLAVDAPDALAGPYLLVVLECEGGDADCA